jgi:hypothetical protein
MTGLSALPSALRRPNNRRATVLVVIARVSSKGEQFQASDGAALAAVLSARALIPAHGGCWTAASRARPEAGGWSRCVVARNLRAGLVARACGRDVGLWRSRLR